MFSDWQTLYYAHVLFGGHESELFIDLFPFE